MRDDLGNKFNDRWEQGRQRWEERMERRGKNSHVWTGAFILLIGVAALLKVSNPDLPAWVFSWKTFLIALGLFVGFKHNFSGGGWLIPIVIGSAFLVADIYPDISIRRYVWPAILIGVGVMLILKPRRSDRWKWPDEKKKTANQPGTNRRTFGC